MPKPKTMLAEISLRDDRLLSTAEAAEKVGLSPKTLREMRSEKCGPRCLKLGKGKQARVAYRLSDLERWVAASVTEVRGG